MFSHAVYGQLGRLEVADTLTVIRELLRGHKYIDKDRWSLHFLSVTYLYLDNVRVCVWGWSYGGFLAASIMADRASSRCRSKTQ